MINMNIMYNVTGRYMDGQKILAYHLVGEDGSQACESKERVIYLIGKGIIANMRTQSSPDGKMIIRGKGINLNTLPVYDSNKNKFRDNSMSQAAQNSGVSVAKSNTPNINQMGQYRIVRRIMFKKKCLGYEVQDYSNSIKRFSREKVIDLAIQKLISNAVANKVTVRDANGQPKIQIVLRGVGCNLNDIPMLLCDSKGNIIDPNKNMDLLTVRGSRIKRSGIIKDNQSNKTIQFRAGDYIICDPSGSICVKPEVDIIQRYELDNEAEHAVCDDYLDNTVRYNLEVFGGKPIQMNPNIVRSWTVMIPAKAQRK